MEVDHRDVRELVDQIVLEADALGGAGRTLRSATRRSAAPDRARRAEHEHEPAVARLAPFDIANARDARADDRGRECRTASCRRRGSARARRSARSTDTSGSGDGPVQNAPSMNPLVRLEVVAIGDRELASRAPCRSGAPHRRRRAWSPGRSTPTTRARSTGISCDSPTPCAGSRRNARTPSAWPRWMSSRNMSGESAGDLDRELAEQARLQRPDADDEERAEPDGEQDDARLVAGPRQVQAPRAAAGTIASSRAARPGRPAPGRPRSARAPARQSRRTTTRPTLSDAACQAVSADQRRRHGDQDGAADPVRAAGRACRRAAAATA